MLSPSTTLHSVSKGSLALRGEKLRNRIESLRVPRNDHHQRVAQRVLLQRVEEQFLLSLPRARGEECPSISKAPPELRRERLASGRGLHVKLEISRDFDLTRAKRPKPVGVFGGLRRDGA
jgi:hypothetical protein